MSHDTREEEMMPESEWWKNLSTERKLQEMRIAKDTGWGYFYDEVQKRICIAEAAVQLAAACRSGEGATEALEAFEKVGDPVCLVCTAYRTCAGTPEKCVQEMAEEEKAS